MTLEEDGNKRGPGFKRPIAKVEEDEVVEDKEKAPIMQLF